MATYELMFCQEKEELCDDDEAEEGRCKAFGDRGRRWRLLLTKTRCDPVDGSYVGH